MSLLASENPAETLHQGSGGRNFREVAVGQPLQEGAITLIGRAATSAIAEVSADRAGLFRTQLIIQIFPESALDL
jgi:hypothetical protein